jgi:hypothetical protein
MTLPSLRETAGLLLIERNGPVGRHYRVEASVYPNPVCQCENVACL